MKFSSVVLQSFLILVLCFVQVAAQSDQAAFIVKLSSTAISPNSDGKKDFVLISLARVMPDLEDPLSWECEIINHTGERVFLFRSDMRLKRANRKINNLFMPSDNNIQPVALFESLLWDGRVNGGGIAPDGLYQVRVHIVDAYQSKIWSELSQKFLVDTSAPQIELSPRISYIAFDNNGLPSDNQARLIINQKSKSSALDVAFRARLYDFEGNLKYETRWANELPSKVEIFWKDILSSETNPGSRFRYQLHAEDLAGNQAIVENRDLQLADRFYAASISADRLAFSPDNNGIGDFIHFDVFRINTSGLALNSGSGRYLFQIVDEANAEVVFQKHGTGNFPQKIRWDGRNAQGVVLDDGKYLAKVIIDGVDESVPFVFLIDTDAKSGSLSVNQTEFYPDVSGNAQYIKARLNFDEDEIAEWRLALVLKPDIDTKESGLKKFEKVYKYYSGTTNDAVFVWDGYSDSGDEPFSLEKFVFRYELIDMAGNQYIRNSSGIQTGFMFRPLQAGSKRISARIPLQGYFNADGTLTDKGEDLVDTVVSGLKYYGLYKISFEVHSFALGREEANLVKTEIRANALNDYLKKIWNKKKKYEYRGFGETELLYYEHNLFDHYRNERIEIRLEPSVH